MTTFKLFADKMGGRDASQFIGKAGEIFYDQLSKELRFSDGVTPGGELLQTGGVIQTNKLVNNDLEFVLDEDGNLTLPENGDIKDIDGKSLIKTAYGCFHKTANVIAEAANVVYNFDWYNDSTAHVMNGVEVVSSQPTRIVISNEGDYKVFVEMQVKSTGNAERDVFIWLAKNGTDLPETGVKIQIRGGGTINPVYQLLSKQWLLDGITENDYLQLRFSVSDEDRISLEYSAAQTVPYVRPAVPSAVLTVTKV